MPEGEELSVALADAAERLSGRWVPRKQRLETVFVVAVVVAVQAAWVVACAYAAYRFL